MPRNYYLPQRKTRKPIEAHYYLPPIVINVAAIGLEVLGFLEIGKAVVRILQLYVHARSLYQSVDFQFLAGRVAANDGSEIGQCALVLAEQQVESPPQQGDFHGVHGCVVGREAV